MVLQLDGRPASHFSSGGTLLALNEPDRADQADMTVGILGAAGGA